MIKLAGEYTYLCFNLTALNKWNADDSQGEVSSEKRKPVLNCSRDCP